MQVLAENLKTELISARHCSNYENREISPLYREYLLSLVNYLNIDVIHFRFSQRI